MSGESLPTLSILVPVFNERDWVESSLRAVHAAQLPLVGRRDVIVVDDASSDGTSDILTKLQKELSFTLLRQGHNQGKGAAIRRAIAEAKGDYIVVHDADLEYDPNDLHKLLVPLVTNKADVVYGSRFVGSEMRRLLFFWHQMGNRLITLLVNMFTNLNFTDVETCYKMFRAEALKNLSLESSRFGIEIELTMKAARRQLRFYEVAIAYNGRNYQQGKKITWKDGVSALYHILKYTFAR